jgi:hypothetical protein
MARVLRGLGTAQAAIYQQSGWKRIRSRVGWSCDGSGSFGSHSRFVAAIAYRCKYSSVVSDRECWANIHGALRSVYFLWRFGLFKKMNSGFVAVVRQKIRRFFETETAQRAARVHVPRSNGILGLFT